jgi:uncharacterized membrane protein YfcA
VEIVFGFLIALMVGLTGVGGGSFTVPVLTLALGMNAAQAVGTALVFATVTKVVATPVYLFRQQIHAKSVVALLAGGLPGVALGAWVLSRMSAKGLQSAVLAVVGATIAVLALMSLWRLTCGERVAPERTREGWLGPLALAIGVQVGFAAAGAGSLGTLALMRFTALTTAQVVGTSLMFGLVLSAVGGGLHLALGDIGAGVLLKLCAGGVAGAALGAHLGTRVRSRSLRAVLSSVLVVLGGQLCWKGLHALAR